LGEPKCYRCGKPIRFDSNIKSKTGKYIPLDPNTNIPHNCEKPVIYSSRPSKQSSNKGVTYAVAAVIVLIVVMFGIGALANFNNIQNENSLKQDGTIEHQNQVENPASSNSYNNIGTTNYNADNAQYFTGKVTEIIDGDTIKVDGKSVRFALASTPELNEPMGQAAKKYVQEICPLGSTVTVDEDDGQTEGSYGRIVAKVTCNGVNLNQAIIEKGFGHLSFVFCDRSEFSGDSWSGCSSPTQKTISSTYSSTYSSSSNCDPNYSGVCIPKGSPDLDCADIEGPVKVTGSDPHHLDRDGDGIGCE